MAEKVIAASLKLDTGGADNSVKAFKTQLKEANAELLTMQQRFGATSAEAVAAAKKVANLKDAIGDAKGLTDAFNPDAKFKAFGNALQGVVGGFSGLTGAMALFGGQSKAVEESLLKVQAAMALSQGVNSVLEAKDSFIQLGAKIKDIGIFQKANALATNLATGAMKLFGVAANTTSNSFKLLKGAIAATGVGLLVVVLGEAVSAFQEFSGAADDAREAQEKFNEETTKGAEETLKINNNFIDRQTKLAVAKAKLAGASEKEIFEIENKGRVDRANNQVEFTNKIAAIDEKAAEDSRRLTKDLVTDGITARIEFEAKQKQARENEAKERQKAHEAEIKQNKEKNKALLKQQLEDRAELAKSQREARLKEREDELAFGEQLAADDKAREEAEVKRLADNERTRLENIAKNAELNALNNPDSIEAKIEKIKADSALEIAALAEGDLQRQILAKQTADEIVKVEKEAAEAKKKITELTEAQKVQLVVSGLELISQAIGKASTAGKVVAVASATISTIQGAINAFTSLSVIPIVGPALGAIAAAAAVASGYANIKKILAVKTPGGGGGGSVPTIDTPAIAPLRPQAQSTQLDQGSINRIGSAVGDNRAFVLDADIQDNADRSARLTRAARLGG